MLGGRSRETVSRLPGGDLVLSSTTEAAIIATKAASISTKTSSVAAKASSITSTEAASVSAEATTKAIVRLVISTIAPLNGLCVFRLELVKEVRDLLLGLDENLDQIFRNVFVAVIVERGGLAFVADTRSATDTVNVLRNAVMLSGREVVVDDVLDVSDIKTTSSHTSSDQYGAAGSTEGASVYCQ